MQTTSQLNAITGAEHTAVMSSPFAHLFTSNSEGKMHSMHHEKFDATGWTSPNGIEVLPSNVVYQDTGKVAIVTYKLETGYKFLDSSTLGVDTPSTELKDEYKGMYRYRYARNLPFKIAKECRFGSSDTDIGSINPYGQEALYDAFTPAGHKEALERDMGHTTICEWSTTSMPQKTVYAPQQFGYSLCGSVKAWPLYKQKKTAKVFHEYKFHLNILKFIEMEKFDEEAVKWVMHVPDASLFKTLPVAFAQPRLYCKVSDVSPLEMAKRGESLETNDFYIFKMIKCELANKFRPGTSVPIPITSPGLCQALFFSMENVTYKKYNRTSYTVDVHEDEWSKSSIESCSLSVAQGAKYKDLHSQLLETQMSLRALPSKGAKKGIHCHLYVNYVGAENNGGAYLSELNTVMKNTISSEAASGSVFKPRVQMLVIQCCTFNEDGTFKIV